MKNEIRGANFPLVFLVFTELKVNVATFLYNNNNIHPYDISHLASITIVLNSTILNSRLSNNGK